MEFVTAVKSNKITPDSFEFLKILGRGSYGTVTLCKEKVNQRLFAVKFMKKRDLVNSDNISKALVENKILKSINHPFLTALMYSYQTCDFICFVMEYVSGGDLFFHLTKERMFSEEKSRFYAAEIICGIGYLHRRGIIHRDVKAENILIDSEGHVKIADFGLAKESIQLGATTTSFCGTEQYMAPEVLTGLDYGHAVDWWAFGVLLYQMICGSFPFGGDNFDGLVKMVVYTELQLPEIVSSTAKHLLLGLLRKSPGQRLGSGAEDAAEIMQHPFFSKINWLDVVKKRIPPPFKPSMDTATDTRYFDDECTSESVELSCSDGLTTGSLDTHFLDFSFQDLACDESVELSCSDGSTMGSLDTHFLDFRFQDLACDS